MRALSIGGILALGFVSSFIRADTPVDPFSLDFLNKQFDSGIYTIEKLLPTLPKELLSNHVQVTHPSGDEGGDEVDPRTVLFDPAGRIKISFNGRDDQEGFYSLQVSTREAGTDKIKIHSITFDKTGKTRPHVSEGMPGRCEKCHGREPEAHENYDDYQAWLGTFGALDDRIPQDKATLETLMNKPLLEGRDNVANQLKRKEHDPRLDLIPDQAKHYDDFLAHAKTHERYKHLINPPARPGMVGAYSTGYKEGELSLDYSPNTKFSFVVARNQSRRIYGKIRTADFYDKYKLFLVASFADCTFMKPKKLSEYGLPQLSDEDEVEEKKKVKKLADEISRDMTRAGLVTKDENPVPIDVGYLGQSMYALLGASKARGFWSNNKTNSGGPIQDGSASTVGSQIANFVGTDVAKDLAALKPMLGQGSLLSRYKEGTDQYGFADLKTVEALDSIAVGLVNDRTDRAFGRFKLQKICTKIRPALNEALDKLASVQPEIKTTPATDSDGSQNPKRHKAATKP